MMEDSHQLLIAILGDPNKSPRQAVTLRACAEEDTDQQMFSSWKVSSTASQAPDELTVFVAFGSAPHVLILAMGRQSLAHTSSLRAEWGSRDLAGLFQDSRGLVVDGKEKVPAVSQAGAV